MKKRILALLLTLVLLVFGAVFAVSASEVEDSGEDTTTYEGIEAEDCPCGCGIKIGDILTQGTEFSTSSTATGHYWATTGKGFGSTINFATSNSTIVIYLKGTNWGKTSAIKTAATDTTEAVYFDMRTFTIGYNTTGVKVYIIGNEGVLTGAGKDKTSSNNQSGGIGYVYSGSELHLMGDLEVKLASDTPNVPQSGGLIYSAGTVTVSDGVTMTGTAVNAYGGAIYMASGADLTVTDSSITGGTAVNGGAIYMTSGTSSNYGTLTMSGNSTITGAAVTGCGGAIYSRGYTTINLNGGTVTGGSSTKASATTGLTYFPDMEGCGGNIYAERGCTVNVACTVQSGTAATGAGGNIAAAGIVNVKPGALIKDGSALQGGNIYCYDPYSTETTARQARLFITGGTIQDGTATAGNGGNVYVNGSGSTSTALGDKFTMSAGEILRGTATGSATSKGGGIYMVNTKFTMSGGTINGGKATIGGCLMVDTSSYNKGELVLSGGTITLGEALRGGNMYTSRKVTVSGATEISFGKALHSYRFGEDTETTAMGGNIVAHQNNFTIDGEGVVVKNGQSDYNGGNIHAGLGGGNYIIFNLKAGTVSEGTAANDGGNIYASSTSTSSGVGLFVSGGTVEKGTAVQHGGYRSNNIHVENCDMGFTGGAVNNTVTSIKAGDAIYVNNATLTIGGTATANYKESHNIYPTASASLVVKADFTGEVWIYTWGRLMAAEDGGEVYGTKLTSYTDDEGAINASGTTTATGVYTGKVCLASTTEGSGAGRVEEQKSYASYVAGVGILAAGENLGTEEAPSYELYIAEAAVTGETEGEAFTTWYATIAEAVAAAAGQTDRYVVLYKAENEVTVAEGQVVYINFRDKKATVTNNGTIYGFDSYCGPTAEANSAVTVTGNALETQVQAPAPDGNFYIALVNEGVTTFHELTLEITGVSLRATAEDASLYYTAEIKADDTLWAALSRAGVAVTLKDDAATLATDYMFTDEYAKGVGTFHGVLVSGIVSETNTLAGRAEAPIYAKAYVTLNGEDILSTAVVDMSLKDVVDKIAAVYYTFSDGQKASFDALYDAEWFQGIGDTGYWATKVTTAPEV